MQLTRVFGKSIKSTKSTYKGIWKKYQKYQINLQWYLEKVSKVPNQLTRVFGRRPFRTAWLTDPYTCSLSALVQLDLVGVMSICFQYSVNIYSKLFKYSFIMLSIYFQYSFNVVLFGPWPPVGLVDDVVDSDG